MLIGKRQRRIEDDPLLRGQGRFVANLNFPDQMYMRVVRSAIAYGKIIEIELDEAKAVPGVLDIWTPQSVVDVNPIPIRQVNLPDMDQCRQYVLARDYVRYVGDPVAVVFASDPYIAEDAADLVFIDIDELDPCLDAAGPIAEFKPGIGSEVGVIEKGYGDLAAAFATADQVIELNLKVGRHAGVPLETRGAIGVFDEAKDEYQLYGAAKIPHRNRWLLSGILEHPIEKINLFEGHVGGGFGVRGELYPEDILVLVAAKRFKRPVKWIEDRKENLVATNHSRQQTHHIKAAIDNNGFILGLEDTFWLDQGGYVRTHGGAVPDLTAAMLPGPYVIPAYKCTGHIRLTNKTPCGTYRAPGRFEGTFVRERLMDAIALKLSIDRMEIRRVNLIAEKDMPLNRQMSALDIEVVLDSGKYEDLLNRLIEYVDYEALKIEINQRRETGECVGIGMAYFVEKSGLGPKENAEIILEPDGKVEIVTGTASVGQGVETVLAQIGADATGLSFDDIRVTHGQTNRIEFGLGASASRATTMSGTAVHLAGENFNENLRNAATEILQISADDLVVENGKIRPQASPDGPSISSKDLAAELAKSGDEPISGKAIFTTDHMGYPYGIHFVVVNINRDTAHVNIEKLAIAYDIGKAINPWLVEGQFAGGAAQGIGGALLEEFTYDDSGQPQSVSFADYMMPTIHEVPELDVLLREDAPSPINPLGVKGAGEGGITAIGAAIASAVDDAIDGQGAITQLPITPSRLHAIMKDLKTNSCAE